VEREKVTWPLERSYRPALLSEPLCYRIGKRLKGGHAAGEPYQADKASYVGAAGIYLRHRALVFKHNARHKTLPAGLFQSGRQRETQLTHLFIAWLE
jgi:hypothetical protein